MKIIRKAFSKSSDEKYDELERQKNRLEDAYRKSNKDDKYYWDRRWTQGVSDKYSELNKKSKKAARKGAVVGTVLGGGIPVAAGVLAAKAGAGEYAALAVPATMAGALIGGAAGAEGARKRAIRRNNDHANRHLKVAMDDIEKYYRSNKATKKKMREDLGTSKVGLNIEEDED